MAVCLVCVRLKRILLWRYRAFSISLLCLLLVYSLLLLPPHFSVKNEGERRLPLDYVEPKVEPNNRLPNKPNNFRVNQSIAEDPTESQVSVNKQVIRNILTNVARGLRRAQRLTRTAEAKIHITSSQKALEEAFSELGLTYNEGDEPKDSDQGHGKLLSVCPEKYLGSTTGYPFFYKGFDTVNCANVKPINQVVSIILNFRSLPDTQQHAERVLSGISKHYPGMTVHLALPDDLEVSSVDLDCRVYKDGFSEPTAANIWSFLFEQAKTPYVLIGKDITHFTADARLERLIREAEYQLVDFVGGASRFSTGHWNIGCYQTVYRNYTLIYTDGYDYSLHECVYCDYISGPFLARTNKLRGIQLQSDFHDATIFQELFLILQYKIKTHAIVCPDSMFHVEDTSPKWKEKSAWKPFAKKYKIFELRLPGGTDHSFKCDEVTSCSKKRGIALNQCCLEDLTRIIHFIMDTCEKKNMMCELQEGTLLGAVKFGKVLPWERDADITFHTANFTMLKSLRSYFRQSAYSLSPRDKIWCCVDGRPAGGTAIAYSRFWHVELYGQHWMDSEILADDGMPPTKINFAGKWVPVPRNPGLYVRNRYGSEMYRHAQHWMTNSGMNTGWDKYDTGGFSQCPTPGFPGFSGCLDQFDPDGNLQFRDPCP